MNGWKPRAPVPRTFLADLHLHTRRSDGAMSAVALVAHVARRTAIGLIAITDHDDIAGAIEARGRALEGGPGSLEVVVGTEVTSAWGRHLLALFPRPPFPSRPLRRYRGLGDTVASIRDLGGLVVVPHPATPLVPSLGEDDIRRLVDRGHPVDAIEACTGAFRGMRREARMRALAAELGVAVIGSSDAHHLAHVGKAVTVVPALSPHKSESLVAAIAARATDARWGSAGRVGPRAMLGQAGRAWALKPAREALEALRSAVGRRRWQFLPESR